MARFLKDLLQNDHPLFLMNIARLERAAGDPGIDVRLIGDITDKANHIIHELGLDPSDTTGSELYHALQGAVKNGRAQTLLEDAPYVLASYDEGPVSLNIRDVIENTHHELPYEKRTMAHAQRRLRMEIIRRYAEHERTHPDVVHQLAHEVGLVQEYDKEHAMHDSDTTTEPTAYVLAIGDIFTDAFIKLKDEEARIITDDEGVEWLGVKFGQKMPYDEVDIVSSVGPSPNASVSFSRLGLRSGLMAWLGDDQVGRDSFTYLKQQGVDTSTLATEPNAKSTYWYVLRYGADRTMLVKNEDYTYEWQEPAEVPSWIYLSQISPNAWDVHEKLLGYLEAHPEVKLAFQPGTSHFRWGIDKLRAIYKRSHIVVMNREEAVDVTGKDHNSLRDLTIALHDLGPHIVVITDGPNGSYASYDFKLVTIPNYPDPAPPFERTGAGDAFASTIVAALARGESMDTALSWAPINSAYVVQKLGAQAGLLTHEALQGYLAAAPEEYKIREITE